jgi:hypothetical protein
VELMAFWKYDQYPYLLCSKILKFKDNGKVSVEGYSGFSFKPLFIVKYEEGVKLKDKLNLLEKDREYTIKQVKDQYIDELESLVGGLINEDFWSSIN